MFRNSAAGEKNQVFCIWNAIFVKGIQHFQCSKSQNFLPPPLEKKYWVPPLFQKGEKQWGELKGGPNDMTWYYSVFFLLFHKPKDFLLQKIFRPSGGFTPQNSSKNFSALRADPPPSPKQGINSFIINHEWCFSISPPQAENFDVFETFLGGFPLIFLRKSQIFRSQISLIFTYLKIFGIFRYEHFSQISRT